jgi:RNA polymerase sigma-70 factor, ECF subfamily
VSPSDRPAATTAAVVDSAPNEDAALVARALRNEGAAFRALYDRYRPAVQRVARGFGELDRDDVEDVIQEAFVRAFQNLAGLKEPARFAPWLLTIARNRALTRLARRRSAQDVADGLEHEAKAMEESHEPPDPTAEAEIEVVRKVIAELPDGPEKETVHLFYVEGKLSAREIAERLGVGKSAITMRLERFRGKVKKKVLAEVAKLRGEES